MLPALCVFAQSCHQDLSTGHFKLASTQSGEVVIRGGSTLGQGHVPPQMSPQIHLSPQIQKLADRSGVISEVPNAPKS